MCVHAVNGGTVVELPLLLCKSWWMQTLYEHTSFVYRSQSIGPCISHKITMVICTTCDCAIFVSFQSDSCKIINILYLSHYCSYMYAHRSKTHNGTDINALWLLQIDATLNRARASEIVMEFEGFAEICVTLDSPPTTEVNVTLETDDTPTGAQGKLLYLHARKL